MEEKKMPTWLIVLLIVVGLCLVGFGVWYGVNHFKDDDITSIIYNDYSRLSYLIY